MLTVIVSARWIREVEFDIAAGALAIEPGSSQPLMAANDNGLASPLLPFPEDWSDCLASPPEANPPDLDFGMSPWLITS